MSGHGAVLTAQLEAVSADERARAIRMLLRHPLLTPLRPKPGLLSLVRRHERFLRRWFSEWLGYRLAVESDCARLFKATRLGDPPRPLRARSGTAFGPRHYALLCFVLAALEKIEAQTSLSYLAENVQLLSASTPGVRPLDLDRTSERRAFVAVMQALADFGCVELTDGDEEGYARGSAQADALYDVHPYRLRQLLGAAVPPSTVEGPEELILDPYPDTDEGRRRRCRHLLMRRLVEQPVVYYDEVSEDERAYARTSRHVLVRQLRDVCGFEVEVRAEGIAALDDSEEATDLRFPLEGTLGHAALLVAEWLAARARGAPERRAVVPVSEVESTVAKLVARHGHHWRAEVRDEGGAARLAHDALGRLSEFGLVRVTDSGVEPRPALARFAPKGGRS